MPRNTGMTIEAMRASMPLSRMMRSSPVVSSATAAIRSPANSQKSGRGNKKERDRVDPLFV
jgi:hypothetical protein